jgi:hypothetical protein
MSHIAAAMIPLRPAEGAKASGDAACMFAVEQ